MTIKNRAFLLYSKGFLKEIDRVRKSPETTQLEVLNYLLKNGRDTLFGSKHKFDSVKNYDDFSRTVLISDYNAFFFYYDLLSKGE